MSPPGHVPLDAEAILTVLERHQVLYVVVGGYAAELHGSMARTLDVDVVPETGRENLDRLADALRKLGSRIRTDAVPEGLPFATSGEALAGLRMLNLMTVHGELDLTFTPSGTEGYPDLARAATLHDVGAVRVHLAALDDVIRSKTAANRQKDRRALPSLGAAWPPPSEGTQTPAASAPISRCPRARRRGRRPRSPGQPVERHRGAAPVLEALAP